MKVERLVTKCNGAFINVVDKNEDFIAFAGKTEDPNALFTSLEFYLGALTTKYNKILTAAQNYTNSGAEEAREFLEPRTSILS